MTIAATDIFTIIPNWLPGWLGAGAAAGGSFGVIKWVAEFISSRIDKRAAALDADTRFVIENLRGELSRMAARQEHSDQRLAAAEGEIRDLRDQLADCQSKHAESEARVMLLEARQQGYSEARDRAQTIIAAERLADRQKGQ